MDISGRFREDVQSVGVYPLAELNYLVGLNSTTIWWSTADPLMNRQSTRLNISSDVALCANSVGMQIQADPLSFILFWLPYFLTG